MDKPTNWDGWIMDWARLTVAHFAGALQLMFAACILCSATPSDALAEHTQSCNDRDYKVSDHFSIACSNSWQFDGVCTGGDMWDQWKVTSSPPSKDAFVHPWLKRHVTVIGYELVKMSGGGDARSWFMIGSTIQPDAMVWLPPGQTHGKTMWPSGVGQPWPSTDEPDPTAGPNMLDLHGWCPKGDRVSIMLTIYYTPEWDSPAH
jgi:hypothetical protein